jgi:long-chain acyl-CoA synthetase
MKLDLSRIGSLGEALHDALLTFKSNPALWEIDRHRETGRFSYTELRHAAERITAALQADGFRAGDRCAILMSNQNRWTVSAVGALWAGAVLVPLDYKLTAPEQLALLRHARPKLLVVEYPIYLDLCGLPDALDPGLRILVSEAPEAAALGANARRWELATGDDARIVARRRDDLAALVYSSGTGGTPKGCMLSHGNYLSQAHVLGRMFPMQESDVYFSILPTNHAIDFMCGLIVPLLFGASVVHQRTLRAEFLAPTMKHYGVTHMAVVPRILKAIRERIDEQLDELPGWKRAAIDALTEANALATLRTPNPTLSRSLLRPLHERFGGKLKLLVAGGAFVEPELAEYFYRLGFPVAIGYGLTEACTVITVNDLKPFRPNTVGRPVEGVEIEVRAANAEGVGEVYARGPTLMRGYLDAEALTQETLVDGWLRTGDLGRIDAAGHLQLLGRARNMIVTAGGKNVYPEDVEAGLGKVECEELCVFGSGYLWPGAALTDERLVAVVRCKKEQRPEQVVAALREHNRGLVAFKRVAGYVMWQDEFPRTASMKVKRDQLAAQVRKLSPNAEELSG